MSVRGIPILELYQGGSVVGTVSIKNGVFYRFPARIGLYEEFDAIRIYETASGESVPVAHLRALPFDSRVFFRGVLGNGWNDLRVVIPSRCFSGASGAMFLNAKLRPGPATNVWVYPGLSDTSNEPRYGSRTTFGGLFAAAGDDPAVGHPFVPPLVSVNKTKKILLLDLTRTDPWGAANGIALVAGPIHATILRSPDPTGTPESELIATRFRIARFARVVDVRGPKGEGNDTGRTLDLPYLGLRLHVDEGLSLIQQPWPDGKPLHPPPGGPSPDDDAEDTGERVGYRLGIELSNGVATRWWNDTVALPHHGAVRTVDASRPLSPVPLFDPQASTANEHRDWALRVDAIDERPDVALVRPAQIVVDGTPADPGNEDIVLRLASRWLEPVEVVVDTDADGSEREVPRRAVTASFPGYRTHRGMPLRYGVELIPDPRGAENVARGGRTPEILAVFRPLAESAHLTDRLRLDALDLRAGAEADDFDPDRYASSLLVWTRSETFGPHRSARLPEVEAVVVFPILAIEPGTQDDVAVDPSIRDDAACADSGSAGDVFSPPAPILVPAGEEAQRTGTFALEVAETTQTADSRSLTMRLREFSGEGGGNGSTSAHDGLRIPLVVLDRTPLLVARVDVPVIRARAGLASSNEVAVWRVDAGSATPRWLLARDDDFRLLLPPQAIGEAMEKGRAPAYDDVDEHEPIDFRLGRSARFDLRSTRLERRFTEAPWNLRRLLGQPGEEFPGALLGEFEFELLYGLETRARTSYVRLAEVSAGLGQIAGRVESPLRWYKDDPRQTRLRAWADAWVDLYRRYGTRLSILEPWSLLVETTSESEKAGGRGLVLTTGVDVTLRFAAKLRYPVPGYVPDPNVIPANARHDDGLAGGFAWPFESNNIYENLWKAPRSVNAELSRPVFSSLGGYGYQKAAFDRGKTTIQSETSMGRAYRVTVERYGRIGVLWNLAKHVIVYERTVAPTRQFVSEQDPLLGRPILRKVREYVEILEPTRRYPEEGTAPRLRGFVRASDFKSRIIPVTSRWGRDIADGWEVPLWRRDAPDVYPKPHVVLELSTDPGTGVESIGLDIEDPEKLRFFTRRTTDAEGGGNGNGNGNSGPVTEEDILRDIDRWPATRYVDYPDLPNPVPPDVPPMDSGSADATLADPPAVPSGYGRFTFTLEPGTVAIDLVAERAASSIGALVRNVSMVRAVQVVKDVSDNVTRAVATLIDLPERVEGWTQQVLDRIPDVGSLTSAARERLRKELDHLLGGIEAEIGHTATQIKDKVLVVTGSAAIDLLDDVTKKARARLDTWSKSASTLLADLGGRLQREITASSGTLAELKARARAILHEVHDGFALTQRNVQTGLEEVRAATESTLASVRALARRLDGEFGDLCGRVDGWLESQTDTARRLLLAEIEAVRARAHAIVHETATVASDRCREWLRDLADEVHRQEERAHVLIDGEIDGVRDAVLDLAADAAAMRRVATQAKQRLAGLARRSLGLLVKRGAAYWSDLERHLDQVQERLEEIELLQRSLAEYIVYLRNSRNALVVDAIGPFLHDWRPVLADGSAEHRDALRARAVMLRDQVAVAVRSAKDEIERRIHDLEDSIPGLRRQTAHIQRRVDRALDSAEARAREFVDDLAEMLEGDVAQVVRAVEPVIADLERVGATLLGSYDLDVFVDEARRVASDFVEEKARALEDWLSSVRERVQDAIDRADAEHLLEEIGNELTELRAGLDGAVTGLRDEVEQRLREIGRDVLGKIDPEDLETWFGEQIGGRLRDAIGKLTDAPAVVRRRLEAVGRDYRNRIEAIGDRLRDKIRTAANGATIAQEADRALRLLRSFGNPPTVPGLEFNRKRWACYFDELKRAVGVHPAAALVDRVGDHLKALGVRLPTRELLDRFVPADLRDFDFATIFPDFAGIKLDGLFPSLRVPALANDTVQIRHGIDPQSRRGWLEALIDVPIGEPSTLFSFGPITLRVRDARFFAKIQIEAGLSGPPTRRVEGRLTADWEMIVAGTPLVTFVATTLSFDESGHIRFDISPDRVRLHGIVKLVSDLINSIQTSRGGFTVRLRQEGGFPIGVEALLDLPLPPIQSGTFGISGLYLGSMFDVTVRPGGPTGVDFSIGTSISVGRPDNPFHMTIFVLGGGGWVSAGVRYAPLTGRITTTVAVGIGVGAKLGIEFGPIRGSVSAFLAIYVEFHRQTGGGSELAAGALFILRGEVSILSLVSASITLMLEARYLESNEEKYLLARGSLRYEIDICWFLSIDVTVAVEYKYSLKDDSNEATGATRIRDDRDAAERYVAMMDYDTIEA